MPTRRIYVPLTHEQVRELAAERLLAAPLQGYAAGSPGRVDARLSPAASQDEAEHLAFLAAAGHAARLDEGARRIIASADAPEDTIREVPGTASGPVPVVIAEDLPLRALASLHIDEAVAGAGDDVDEDADESDTEPDLLWYDITELDTVVGELDR
ncbi:MAG: hypothetical protein ABR500_09830 [Dermatophilaceae bacterium]|nr:hypothetical protein [Intrasporangiaceae bacterium]